MTSGISYPQPSTSAASASLETASETSNGGLDTVIDVVDVRIVVKGDGIVATAGASREVFKTPRVDASTSLLETEIDEKVDD